MELREDALRRAAERARGVVKEGALPCAVVAVAGREGPPRLWACGEGGREAPELAERIFLLASISKAITGVGMARLVDEGRIAYDDPVARHIPEFAADEGRARITVGHILTHASGLPPRPLTDCVGERLAPADAWRLSLEGDLLFEPGAGMCYATHTYQLLCEIVFRVLGKRMSQFLAESVYRPCGMPDTGFRPQPRARAMPVVDFPLPGPDGLERLARAELAGAGIWSTARDLVKLGQAVLRPGPLLRPETHERMLRPHHGTRWGSSAPTCRTWGWVKEAQPHFPNRPEAGFYHGGATGTLLWVDPERALVFVFLSSIWCSCNDQAFATLACLYG